MLKLICSQIFAKFKFNHYQDENELVTCVYQKFVIRQICTIFRVSQDCSLSNFLFFILDDVLIFVVTFFFSLTIVLIADVFRF